MSEGDCFKGLERHNKAQWFTKTTLQPIRTYF